MFELAQGVKPKISEEAQNRNTRIKEDIVKLLAETVSRPSDTVKQEVSRRCQALASFMETLMDEVTRADLKLEMPHENELTVSERDSVMLGEISPHHDYYDSKSSTETPPSYNQLNYNENLLRFFNSKPVTAPVELDPPKLESSYVSSAREDARSTLSPVHGFEGSGGSGSSGNFTTGSNVRMSSVTNTSNAGTGTSGGGNSAGGASGGVGAVGVAANAPLVTVTLTESLLNKHNDEMEKFMLKKHRESRGRSGEKNKKSANEKMLEYSGPGHGHGIKRGGSHSWEGEANKPKQQLTLNAVGVNANVGVAVGVGGPDGKCGQPPGSQTMANNQQFVQGSLNCTQNINLWPPFSVGITTPSAHTSTHTAVAQSNFSPQQHSLFPAFYYIPASLANASSPGANHKSCDQPSTSQQAAAAAAMPLQYMAGVMYPHPSLFYSHPAAAAAATAMMYQPMPFSSVGNVMKLPDRGSNGSQASYNKTVYSVGRPTMHDACGFVLIFSCLCRPNRLWWLHCRRPIRHRVPFTRLHPRSCSDRHRRRRL